MNSNTPRQRRIARSRASIHGTASQPRIVVERTNKHFRAQLIDDDQGRSVAAASDQPAKDSTGTTRAEAVGTDLAAKAAKLGIKRAILDRRGYRYHGRVKAFAEAARAAGLSI